MKMTFRWYGPNDSIPLSYIRQIPGMTGVVTAVYDVAPGHEWSNESIAAMRKMCADNGLEMEVIESVPVHEDIKLGRGKRDEYIEAYKTNIRRLAANGVKCICYNFMPVFDWVRTVLGHVNADGSVSLAYREEDILKLDPANLSLPGWDESYTKDELRSLLDAYSTVTHEQLFENYVYFLNKLVPVLEECDVNMAVHPDDPPWDLFGLPRIVSTEADLDRLFAAVPSKRNGLTFCTGSLGAGRPDLVRLAAKYAKEGRIYFAHLRNIKYSGERDFAETGHLSAGGSLDMYGIVKALADNGFDGYVRPDHGRNVWGERGKPGYGLYDRAMGAAYLNGLFEAAEKQGK
ncbi:MAG TPA: mannonate dehydratase [Clostridiales bacterium]|nr:mannonate dehydratase [Clostridiales bacterium]